MNQSRNQYRKSSFNLDKFYEDLQRVQSSLGKGESRKSAKNLQSVKDKIQPKESYLKTIDTFKKQLNRKQLTKTKINLSSPYDHFKQKSSEASNLDRRSNIRSSQQTQSQPRDDFERIRQKLNSLKKEEVKLLNDTSSQIFEIPQSKNRRTDFEESEFSSLLQKTMETPYYEEDSLLTKNLVSELTKRNKIYQMVAKNINQQRGIKRKQPSDLGLLLRENFREDEMMRKIVDQFKKICDLDVSDLKELHSLLKKGIESEQSQQS